MYTYEARLNHTKYSQVFVAIYALVFYNISVSLLNVYSSLDESLTSFSGILMTQESDYLLLTGDLSNEFEPPSGEATAVLYTTRDDLCFNVDGCK